MPRCNPKARPRSSAGVTSAMTASRGGVRSPFPSRSTTRSPITCHAAPVTAMTGRTTTAMKYPSTIMGPRRGTRSANRPAPRGAEVFPQLEDLAPSHRVAQRLGRLGAIAAHLRLRVGAVHAQVRGEVLHPLLERHAPRVQPHVEQDPRRAPQQVYTLEELLLFGAVEPLLPHHVLAVQRPTFDGERRPDDLAGVRGLLLCVYQLQVVAGIA